MKTRINKTLLTLGLMTICSMGFSQIPLSGNSNTTAMDFKCVADLENGPVFKLSLPESGDEVYFVNVKDENNDVLYSEEIKGGNISRKYRLDISDDDFDVSRFKVTFEITSKSTHKTTIYNITKKVNVVQEIMVAKL